jgi:DNA-binding transcriptional LysR family regulator
LNKFMALMVFTRVVEHAGFTAAARKLGMSVSAVTKTIARLEDELGTQLFNRTTRQLSTTDYGQEFYQRCVRILADLEEAETVLRSGSITPRGRIRAVVPLSFGRITLIPELPTFFARFPEITLDLNFSDQGLDLIAEGYDVAVRTGHISDSSLTVRRLINSSILTVAAPKYLKEHGVPKTPADLKDHNCLVGRFGPEWPFRDKDGRKISVRVRGNAIIHSGDALREAAVAGIGIAQGTHWLLRKDLEIGAVKPVLSAYTPEGAPISVLYPANRFLPAKVRAFIDFLIEITKG